MLYFNKNVPKNRKITNLNIEEKACYFHVRVVAAQVHNRADEGRQVGPGDILEERYLAAQELEGPETASTAVGMPLAPWDHRYWRSSERHGLQAALLSRVPAARGSGPCSHRACGRSP